MAQMRVLNSDGANGRLALLSAMLTPADTIRLVRSKLAARAGIAPTTNASAAPSEDASEPAEASASEPAAAAGAPQEQQESVVSVASIAAKLPISTRFAASSPSADHINSKVRTYSPVCFRLIDYEAVLQPAKACMAFVSDE